MENKLKKLLNKWVKKMEKAEKENDMQKYNKCVLAIQEIERLQELSLN